MTDVSGSREIGCGEARSKTISVEGGDGEDADAALVAAGLASHPVAGPGVGVRERSVRDLNQLSVVS